MKKSTSKLLALFAALALIAAACGSDSETVDSAAADDTGEAEASAGAGGLPGEGISLNMGRANWSTGYVHAQILHDLTEELGYDVASPDLLEFAPDLGYQTMASGEMEIWSNSLVDCNY